MGFVWTIFFLCSVISWASTAENHVEDRQQSFQWDPKGYIIFCLCMGRFGNQVEHFLGGMAFAKSIDRTLILPPWRTYKNVGFNEWFQVDGVAKYHRVILAEDFMQFLAAEHWPLAERIGFCFSYGKDKDCKMKEGNPFGPFWDGLGVDFNSTITYSTSYQDPEMWKTKFPVDIYPVLALKGAPASFPMKVEHHQLQQYLLWSHSIKTKGQDYIQKNFPDMKFIGLHLRNGIDWKNACEHVDGMKAFMASPQCLDPLGEKNVSKEMCFPPLEEILRLTKDTVMKSEARVLYVATDKYPYIEELETHLKDYKVKVFHQDPWLPQIDLYILGQSDHFIGNCVSSFTSFVTRERAVYNKPTSFWGFS